MHRFGCFLVVVHFALAVQAQAQARPEIRGVWVDRAPLATRDSIRGMLDDLKDANCNAVFVNVWSRGYPLWKSSVFERHTGLLTDPLYGDRDVLAEVIEEAKLRGLAVVPWVEYGFVIGYSGGKAPLVEAHPEWLARRKDGSADFSWAGTTKSFWIAHSHQEGQQFLLDLMRELAANYDVPAIEFDRARYPELDCGYDDATVFFATPVMRQVELMELHSTKHRITWARRSVSILFILTLMLARARTVNKIRPKPLISNAV
jgi:uncharacterized lipoprotein YddW (UPF0748 family)